MDWSFEKSKEREKKSKEATNKIGTRRTQTLA